MFNLTVEQAKANFFDTKKVARTIEEVKEAKLRRIGGMIRLTAQRSLRYSEKSSKPGNAPHVHKVSVNGRSLLRDYILFSYDRTSESVVIGPGKLHGRSSENIPQVLEFGGQSTVGYKKNRRVVTIAKRPYMGPALEKMRPRIAPIWYRSVK